MAGPAALLPAAASLGRSVLGRIVSYALPARCPGCGTVVADDHSFCLLCWQRLDFLGGPACGACAEPLEIAYGPEARCGACLADPPPFGRLIAAVAYGEIARALALKLKHGGRPGVAVTMARLLGRKLGSIEGMLVVPVPLHRRRLWSRGYNQAALIARALDRGGTATLAVDLLVRRKATPMLRGLGRRARARAVDHAFALDPAWAARVRGARIVLVDDVYTTGATVRACARVLTRAGAAEIVVACWARVLRDGDDRDAAARDDAGR